MIDLICLQNIIKLSATEKESLKTNLFVCHFNISEKNGFVVIFPVILSLHQEEIIQLAIDKLHFVVNSKAPLHSSNFDNQYLDDKKKHLDRKIFRFFKLLDKDVFGKKVVFVAFHRYQ